MDELDRLALASAGGDRIALADFVRQTRPEVWRFCAHLTRPAAADDLTQETFLRALPALSRFRGESSARTWLLAIARHTCMDHLRRDQRQRRLLQRISDRHTTGEATVDPTGRIDLAQLIAGLGADQRTAFVLTQLLGLRYDEAAAVCGCPVGTIRSRVARARESLLRAVGEDGWG